MRCFSFSLEVRMPFLGLVRRGPGFDKEDHRGKQSFKDLRKRKRNACLKQTQACLAYDLRRCHTTLENPSKLLLENLETGHFSQTCSLFHDISSALSRWRVVSIK